MNVVVFGSVFVDVKGYPEDTYIPGGRNAGRVEYVHGGVSRNIAEDVANIGLPCTFVGLVDETGIGQDVIDKLRDAKVDTRYMRKIHNGMGTWLAVFDNSGDVVAAISKRPDLTPISDILREEGDAILSNADCALLELDMGDEQVELVLRYAEKYGVSVYAAVSNMTIAAESKYLRRMDCFVCNLQEAEILFKQDFSQLSTGAIVSVLPSLLKREGISRMVVTMGKMGAVYACADGDSGICPAQPVAVVETTGAGDAFFAGVCAGLTAGKSLGEACEIGTTAASDVIGTIGNVCRRFNPPLV